MHFFIVYVKTGTFTYFENMDSKYINLFIIFLIIGLLIINIFVYLLMQKKEKPIFFYKMLFVYLTLLLIFFLYFRSFFASLDSRTYDSLRIIIYRDISLALYIINYFYVGFSFIRGFGFDIKKFSFDHDKKELMLEETDNEEYEVKLGVDKDNIKNYFKRERRELRYYFKENAKILIVIFLILTISLGGYFAYRYFVYDKVYQEKDLVKINGNTFQIKKIYWTNKDKYGNIIKNSSYVIIDMEIDSPVATLNFDKEKFRLLLNDKYYYVQENDCNLFDDLGKCYYHENFKSNQNYLLVFKVSEEASNGYLEILENKNDYHFRRIAITKEETKEEFKKFKLNEEIILDNQKILLKSFELGKKTSYTYNECLDKCNTFVKTVVPNLNNCVLTLEVIETDYDETLWNNYLGISYTLNGNNYYVSGKDISVLDRHDAKIYLSVPERVMDATKINLVFNIRNIEYDIELR